MFNGFLYVSQRLPRNLRAPATAQRGALLVDGVHGLEPLQRRIGQGAEGGAPDEVLHEDHHVDHLGMGHRTLGTWGRGGEVHRNWDGWDSSSRKLLVRL